MKKPLAVLVTSAAFLALTATSAHAGPARVINDARGDAAAESGNAPISVQAAADLRRIVFKPAKSSVTITWHVAKVAPSAPAGEGVSQTFMAGFGDLSNPRADIGDMSNPRADIGDNRLVVVSRDSFEVLSMESATSCSAAKVTWRAKKVVAKVPYACLGPWRAGTKVPEVAGLVLASEGGRTASDESRYAKGLRLR